MTCRQRKFCVLAAVGIVLCLAMAHSILRSRHQRRHIRLHSLPESRPNASSIKGSPAVGHLDAPLMIHQSWKDPDSLPARFAAWSASWSACFPGWQRRLWTDEDNLKLVRLKAPDFLDHYLRYPNAIQRADSARYLYMYHYGGIYADLDTECLHSFRHLMTGNVSSSLSSSRASSSGCGVILGSMRLRKQKRRRLYIENAFIYSRRGHPFWLSVLEAMIDAARRTGSNNQETVSLTTGPDLLTRAVELHAKTYDSGHEHFGPVCVFPDAYFNPFSWDVEREGPCKDLNRMNDAELGKCRERHKDAYVIHYHAQSWLAGRL